MHDLNIIEPNEAFRDFSKISHVHDFTRRFILYKKDKRYSLHISEYDFKGFAYLFSSYTIDDLFLETTIGEKSSVFQKRTMKFADLFRDQEFIQQHRFQNLRGYFTELDFYFYNEGNRLIFDYIDRNQLQDVFDLILFETECQFRGRLMTELLMNLRFPEELEDSTST